MDVRIFSLYNFHISNFYLRLQLFSMNQRSDTCSNYHSESVSIQPKMPSFLLDESKLRHTLKRTRELIREKVLSATKSYFSLSKLHYLDFSIYFFSFPFFIEKTFHWQIHLLQTIQSFIHAVEKQHNPLPSRKEPNLFFYLVFFSNCR